jgi:GNAT superfamily N-acetyltransferase
VAVVKAVYAEYGFTWEAEGYHADLYDVQAHYWDRGHAFWVALDDSRRVVGTVALKVYDPVPGEPGAITRVAGRVRIAGADCSLDRLYVHPEARRQGLGMRLSELVIAEARSMGRRLMEIWSDKKFEDAHRLYGRLGARQVTDRILDDPDQSPEWGLLLEL